MVRILRQGRRQRTGQRARRRDRHHERLPGRNDRPPGTEYKAANWASLAPGEINLQGAAEQTIEAPGTAPKTAFTSGDRVHDRSRGRKRLGGDLQAGAGAGRRLHDRRLPTVIGEFSTPVNNDQVIARLYDVNEAAGKQRLIGRAIYRPINPDGGFTKQVFQLHPQAWNVAAGHVLKLRAADAGLDLRAQLLARRQLDQGEEPRTARADDRNARAATADSCRRRCRSTCRRATRWRATSTPAAPGAPHVSSGANPNSAGVFTLAWEPSQAAAAPTYTLQHEDAQRQLEHRGERPDEPRIRVHGRRPGGRRDAGPTASPRATKALKANSRALRRKSKSTAAPPSSQPNLRSSVTQTGVTSKRHRQPEG